jgi:hypothetical protein
MHRMHIHTYDGWQPGSRQQRLLAATIALVLTVLLGKQLNTELGQSQQRSLLERINQTHYLPLFNIVLAPILPHREPDKSAPASQPHAAGSKPRPTTTHSVPTATTTSTDLVPTSPPAAGPAAEPAQDIDNRLKLDDKAIARAYRDGRSDLQKMADAAGKTLELPPLSKMQKFDAAMAEAAVPDCFALGQDPLKHNPPKLGQVALSGLLVIPFYIEAIAKGKCK